MLKFYCKVLVIFWFYIITSRPQDYIFSDTSILLLLFSFTELEIKSRALFMPDKYSTTMPHSQPHFLISETEPH